MNKLNLLLIFVLVVISVRCLRDADQENLTNDLDLHEIILKFATSVNKLASRIAGKFYGENADKSKRSISEETFHQKFREALGDLTSVSENPFVVYTPGTGVFTFYGVRLTFRNAIFCISADEAFNGKKFEIPNTKLNKDLVEAINFTKSQYLKLRDSIYRQFENADVEKKGLISLENFLDSFDFEATPTIKEILNFKNIGAEINKEQAFDVLPLLVFESLKEEFPENFENSRLDSNISVDPSSGNSFVPGVGERHIRPKGPAPNLDYADLAVFFGDH